MTLFEIGTVVTLKSGGEKMTVIGDGKEPGTVTCAWYDPHRFLQERDFPTEVLGAVQAVEG